MNFFQHDDHRTDNYAPERKAQFGDSRSPTEVTLDNFLGDGWAVQADPERTSVPPRQLHRAYARSIPARRTVCGLPRTSC